MKSIICCNRLVFTSLHNYSVFNRYQFDQFRQYNSGIRIIIFKFSIFFVSPQDEPVHDAASLQKLPDGSPIIAILVVSCNRITVERCLDQLIKLRPNKEQFPIVVSQDCDHRQTADVIARYGNELLHIKVQQRCNFCV